VERQRDGGRGPIDTKLLTSLGLRVLLLIGFICGYGVRALISHLRRAKVERRQFERMAEEVAQTRKQERLAITFQRSDNTPAPPDR
jgi:hypothetical protein